jgi:hypothetical protein
MKYFNIYDIKIDGPYICKLYHDETNDFENLGEIFMFSEGKFYDKNGNGPWSDSDIEEIQHYVDLYNKDVNNIKCFFELYEEATNYR